LGKTDAADWADAADFLVRVAGVDFLGLMVVGRWLRGAYYIKALEAFYPPSLGGFIGERGLSGVFLVVGGPL
jgi:hypothetical protein